MTHCSDSSAIERLNQDGARRAENIASLTRSEIIDIAYDAVSLYLDEDRSADQVLQEQAYPIGETVGFFVAEDMLIAPGAPANHVRTFGVLLVDAAIRGEALADDEDTDEDDDFTQDADEKDDTAELFDSLQIAVPVGPTDFIENFRMPARQDVHEVHLAYSIGKDQPPLRITVHEDGMYEYTVDADSGTGASALMYEAFLRESMVLVSEEIVTAVKALRNIIHMRAVPQRVFEISGPTDNPS